MSRKNKVILSCSTCNHQFEATLYRTIWGESQENRDLLMNNLFNVVVCPSCNTKTKIEYALFYNDTTVLCGVWWEPYPESEIDQCAAGWAKMFGKDNYMTNAPRLKDWNEFKETINKFYSGELKGTPPIQLGPKQGKRKKHRLPKIPKISLKKIATIIGGLLLMASITVTTVNMFRIRELNEHIADIKQELDNSDNDYSSVINQLESRIDDCESQIYDNEDAIEELQRSSHYHY